MAMRLPGEILDLQALMETLPRAERHAARLFLLYLHTRNPLLQALAVAPGVQPTQDEQAALAEPRESQSTALIPAGARTMPDWTVEAWADLELVDAAAQERIRSAVRRLAAQGRGTVKRVAAGAWRLETRGWSVLVSFLAETNSLQVLRVFPAQQKP